MARRAVNVSQALEVIGNALAPLPGTKSVVLIGWGAGRFNAKTGVVRLGRDYDDALRALHAAHASVIPLSGAREGVVGGGGSWQRLPPQRWDLWDRWDPCAAAVSGESDMRPMGPICPIVSGEGARDALSLDTALTLG